MDIVQKLRSIKQNIQKNKKIDYKKYKNIIINIVDFCFKNQLIDTNQYVRLINKLNNNLISSNYKIAKTSIVKKSIIFVLLLSIIDVLIYKTFIQNKEIETKQIKNLSQSKNTIKNLNNNDNYLDSIPDPPQVQPLDFVFLNDIIDQSCDFIIKLQGTIKGNVYDENGKIIASDVHLVYDDKLPLNHKDKKWDGRLDTLDNFIKNCKGTPTIGYGTTDIISVKKGYIDENEAIRLCKNKIKQIQKILKRRIGGEKYWDFMNNNQKIATLSYFYNCGEYAKATKQFQAIRKKDWKQAAKQMNIIKSDGKIIEGLVRRRKIQQQKFLTK